MANKPIVVAFDQGVQFPPKLGTLILKKTSNGKLAYAQNVDSSNDEYGNGAITPGPALITIAGNSQLTGVPFAKAFYGSSALNIGYLYFIQGLLGAKNVIRRVSNIISGATPAILADGATLTFGIAPSHGPGHANHNLVDVVLRPSGSTAYIYVAGKDDTDTWIYKVEALTFSTSLVATNPDFTGGFTNQFLVLGSDNNIYWIGNDRVSSIDIADNYTPNALVNKLPVGTYASAAVDWNTNLVVAYSNDAFGDFGRRLSAGRSGVVLWDYSNPNFQKNIPAPCRYISAMVVDPTGNLIVFGGVDEGKSSIYEFTGYGFNLLYSYIGDMPHSRHSVEFDGQGRILWQTADGQLCRFDRSSGKFDQLGTLPPGNSAGGLLAKSIGSPLGNEFLMASGAATTFTMKRVAFGNFIGDGGAADTIATPKAVSGIIEVPFNTTIDVITWHLARPLQIGEKVILLVYVNGSTTPIQYSTLDFSVAGAVASKREVKTLTKINNFSLGVIWKMGDNQATAPAVLPAVVEIK